MFPWYHGYRGDGDLPEDDRLAIQEIYGARDGSRQWGLVGPTRVTRRTTAKPTKVTRPTRRYNTRKSTQDRRNNDSAGRRNGIDTNYPPRYPERPRYYPSVTTTTTLSPVDRTTYSWHQTRHHNKHNDKHNDKPDSCNTNYDAISMIRGEIFIFKGRYLWRIGNEGLLGGYPHEISKMWGELLHPLTHVDTVYENKRRQIVFFVGKTNSRIE
jgi:matrix metalloproteinase-16 (membrane-inserted)